MTRYPEKRATLLPALWMVQEARGWISEQAIGEVADVLELTPAYVKGVVTFYTMYHQHPVGKYFIQVCTTTPCHVCSAEDVVKAFLRHTRCGELGVTSPDGKKEVFIKDWNLYVRDVATGQEKQLTTDGLKDFGYATDNAGWVHSDNPVLTWSPDSAQPRALLLARSSI